MGIMKGLDLKKRRGTGFCSKQKVGMADINVAIMYSNGRDDLKCESFNI